MNQNQSKEGKVMFSYYHPVVKFKEALTKNNVVTLTRITLFVTILLDDFSLFIKFGDKLFIDRWGF